MIRGIRFYFGRLNLIPTQDPARKRELLLDGLRHNTTLTRRGIVWGFYQVDEITVSGNVFMHGFLVKYKPQTQEEIVDRKPVNLMSKPLTI